MSTEPTAADKMIRDFASKLVDLTDRVLFGLVGRALSWAAVRLCSGGIE